MLVTSPLQGTPVWVASCSSQIFFEWCNVIYLLPCLLYILREQVAEDLAESEVLATSPLQGCFLLCIYDMYFKVVLTIIFDKLFMYISLLLFLTCT